MPIDLACTCGQRFTLAERPDGPAVCPRCGQAVIATSLSPEGEGTDRIPFQLPERRKDLDGEDMASSQPRRPRPELRRRSLLPTHLLGYEMRARQWVAVLLLTSPLFVLLYFLLPSARCKVLHAKSVNAYAALDVRKRSVKEVFRRVGHSGQLQGGGQTFLVYQDDAEGNAVRVHLRLAARFLNSKAPSIHGSIVLHDTDFQLRRDGDAVDAIFLEDEYPDPAGIRVGLSGGSLDPFIPRDRPPWNPAGETENRAQPEFIRDEDEPRGRGRLTACTGEARFTGTHGPTVRYDYRGDEVVVTWDAPARGVLSTKMQDHMDSFFLQGLELTCLFPQPSGTGPAELWIFGEHVATLSPR